MEKVEVQPVNPSITKQREREREFMKECCLLHSPSWFQKDKSKTVSKNINWLYYFWLLSRSGNKRVNIFDVPSHKMEFVIREFAKFPLISKVKQTQCYSIKFKK